MSALTIRNNNNYGLNMLDDLFGSWGDILSYAPLAPDLHVPRVRELEDKFVISLAAPGLEKKDFNIAVEGNRLTLGYDATDKSDSHAYASKYSKTYTLPHTCEGDAVEATYTNGILAVTLPKTEAAKPRQVKIK